MVTRLLLRQTRWMFGLLGLYCAGALFIASITPSSTLAQSTDDPWDAPLNLSHSGAAVNPAIVSDSDGVVHAVWQDDLANFIYTRLDGDQWSAPETTNLNLLFGMAVASESRDPLQLANYTGPNPLFIAGPSEHIFAFWISPEGRVFTSKVLNQNFAEVAAWDSAHLITPGAASFAAAVDARGELHVAYFRTADDPANPTGIYYTSSKNNGQDWARPVLVYESPYFRRLGEGEANLSLATAGTEDALRVFIAWDNRPRKQVLLAQSADDGEGWEQPVLISGPAPGSGLAGPFNIHVGATQNSVVLVWQSGLAGGTCSQIYQSSRDAGVTWSNPQPLLENLSECAHSNEIVAGLENNPRVPPRMYLLTRTQSQVLLTAWNGLQWSEAQVQPLLSGFEDTEIYKEVIYDCHRAALLGERLYIIGCDQGGGGDVWVTSRDLGPTTSWFTPPVWSQPSPVAGDNLDIEAVKLVATGDNLIHAFFSQRQDPVVYYTYWDGELWSPITPVLEVPDGEAGSPAIAAGPDNELFLMVPSNKGVLYFSRAISGSSGVASNWSTPTRLEISHDGEIGSVDVAWGTTGTLYVAYSVPVNEKRGVYLVESKDYGSSWSEPLQVFNGAAADFDLVGAPSLLASTHGSLHIIWKQQSIQGDGAAQPLSLYYIRSEDGGRTFNDAEVVIDEPVGWRAMAADGNDNLHLLWQRQDTVTTVWDQVSFDGGHSWQIPQGLPSDGSTAAVMVDSLGLLHLVDGVQGSLNHWLWDGSRWRAETPLRWFSASRQEGPVKLLAAAANKQGKMVVLWAIPAGTDAVAETTLIYSARTLELPPIQTGTPEVATETASPTAVTPATPTSERSPTAPSTVGSQPTASQGETDRNETNNRISPLTMALLPVALLLLSVLGIMIRRATRVDDR